MLFDFAILLYLIAFLCVGFNIFLHGEKYLKLANIFAVIAVLVNLSHILLRWWQLSAFPANDMKDIFAMIIFFIGLIAIYLSFKMKKANIYIFIMPIIVILGFVAFAHSAIIIRKTLSSFWLMVHLPFTIFGTALFFVSALFGILYFLQEIQIKKKHFGFLYNILPSIDLLNRINQDTMLSGFMLFTMGLLSGFIWGIYEWKGIIIMTPKLIFSIITFVIFGIIILIKKIKGMTPRNTALASILGIISVIITYVGVALFIKG